MTTNHDGTVDDLEDQGQAQMIEIDGQMVSLDELKNGYLRQSDYTKKTQQLAEEKKALEEFRSSQEQQPQEEYDEDGVKKAEVFMENFLEKRYGLGQMVKSLKEKELDGEFNKFAGYHPEIAGQEKLIKELASSKGMSIEEVVSEYGLIPSDKIEKARNSRPIVGNTTISESRERNLRDIKPGSKEYAEAKAKGLIKLV